MSTIYREFLRDVHIGLLIACFTAATALTLMVAMTRREDT